MLSVVALQRFKVGLVVKCFFHKNNYRERTFSLQDLIFCVFLLLVFARVNRSTQEPSASLWP